MRIFFSFFLTLLVLTGCSLENTINQGADLLKTGNELLEKSEDKISELNANVNKLTSFFDSNILKVQNSKVYDENFTFKELIDNTIKNPIWVNDDKNDGYVMVSGEIKLPISMEEEYGELEEVILGFPFSDGISLANAGVFTTIDGAVKVNGVTYEISGQEVISILCMMYQTK